MSILDERLKNCRKTWWNKRTTVSNLRKMKKIKNTPYTCCTTLNCNYKKQKLKYYNYGMRLCDMWHTFSFFFQVYLILRIQNCYHNTITQNNLLLCKVPWIIRLSVYFIFTLLQYNSKHLITVYFCFVKAKKISIEKQTALGHYKTLTVCITQN